MNSPPKCINEVCSALAKSKKMQAISATTGKSQHAADLPQAERQSRHSKAEQAPCVIRTLWGLVNVLFPDCLALYQLLVCLHRLLAWLRGNKSSSIQAGAQVSMHASAALHGFMQHQTNSRHLVSCKIAHT
jgi:hypothetical protein